MKHFFEGFEKEAAVKINPVPIKTPPPTGTSGAFGSGFRDWLNKGKTKTNIAMGVVGTGALLYGASKALDSVIGSPSLQNEW